MRTLLEEAIDALSVRLLDESLYYLTCQKETPTTDTSNHNLAGLFTDLALDSNEDAINHLMSKYGPLQADIHLIGASSWTSAQTPFLWKG